MKALVTPLLVACLALTLSAANVAVAAPASATTMLTAHLKGMNEVGAPGAPSGTGTATVTINMATGRLCYTLSVSGFKLPAIAAHIHAGKAGKNGPIAVPFPKAPGTTGKASGCTTAKASLLKGIAGHPTSYYVNVHTTAYPGGAVRGQLGM